MVKCFHPRERERARSNFHLESFIPIKIPGFSPSMDVKFVQERQEEEFLPTVAVQMVTVCSF